MDDINKAFILCSGNLRFLPANYKKWHKLHSYRLKWSFIYDSETKEGISEQEMGIDYLWSLNAWLVPTLTIKFSQKLLIFQGIGAIYEAILKDLWKNQIFNSNLKKEIRDIQVNKLEKDSFYNLIKISSKAGFINSEWDIYIHEVRKIRNLGHLIKNQSKRATLLDGIYQKEIHELKNDLKRFREYIQSKYLGGVDIPF